MKIFRRSSLQKNKAMTLLEVLVALIILASAFLGIIMTVVSAKRYAIHSKRRLQAANLARQMLESIRNTNQSLTVGNFGYGATFDGIIYMTNLEIKNSTDTSFDGKVGTVTVRWNETNF